MLSNQENQSSGSGKDRQDKDEWYSKLSVINVDKMSCDLHCELIA